MLMICFEMCFIAGAERKHQSIGEGLHHHVVEVGSGQVYGHCSEEIYFIWYATMYHNTYAILRH